MTDDDLAIYKAIKTVFGDVKTLICHWHLFRSWRRNLNIHVKDKEDRDDIFSMLKLIAEEETKDLFYILLKFFFSRFKKKNLFHF